MRILLCATAVAALVLTGASLVRSGEDKDARAVIAKAIKAMGGEANLVKHQAATWKEKGTYYGMGEGQPYTGEYAAQGPVQFRMEIENVFILVLDNDKGWISSGGNVKEMSKDEFKQQVYDRRASWVASLEPLKDKAFQVKSIADAKVGDQLTAGVQVSRKDYPDVKLYFDKKTGLPVKTEYRTKASEQENKEVTQEVYYSDFRMVDGLQVPHKHVVKRDGKVFVEAEITAMKVAGKLDNKMFSRPGE